MSDGILALVGGIALVAIPVVSLQVALTLLTSNQRTLIALMAFIAVLSALASLALCFSSLAFGFVGVLFGGVMWQLWRWHDRTRGPVADIVVGRPLLDLACTTPEEVSGLMRIEAEVRKASMNGEPKEIRPDADAVADPVGFPELYSRPRLGNDKR
jgi:hypothetical protein